MTAFWNYLFVQLSVNVSGHDNNGYEPFFNALLPHVALEYVQFTDFTGPQRQFLGCVNRGCEYNFFPDDKIGKGSYNSMKSQAYLQHARHVVPYVLVKSVTWIIDKMATNAHYSHSQWNRAHLAVWQNWTRHEDIVALSNNLNNVAPALPLVNMYSLRKIEKRTSRLKFWRGACNHHQPALRSTKTGKLLTRVHVKNRTTDACYHSENFSIFF